MDEQDRKTAILKAITVFEAAVHSDFAPVQSIGAGLAGMYCILNELHAISVALERANELTVEERNRR